MDLSRLEWIPSAGAEDPLGRRGRSAPDGAPPCLRSPQGWNRMKEPDEEEGQPWDGAGKRFKI